MRLDLPQQSVRNPNPMATPNEMAIGWHVRINTLEPAQLLVPTASQASGRALPPIRAPH